MNYRECGCWRVIPNLTAGSRKVRNHRQWHNDMHTTNTVQLWKGETVIPPTQYCHGSTFPWVLIVCVLGPVPWVSLVPHKPLCKVWQSTLLSGLRGTKLNHATGAWSEILDFHDCNQEVWTSQSYRLLSTLGKTMSDAIRMKCQYNVSSDRSLFIKDHPLGACSHLNDGL